MRPAAVLCIRVSHLKDVDDAQRESTLSGVDDRVELSGRESHYCVIIVIEDLGHIKPYVIVEQRGTWNTNLVGYYNTFALRFLGALLEGMNFMNFFRNELSWPIVIAGTARPLTLFSRSAVKKLC